MSRVNEKLGLRPQTTTRKATHARSIVRDATCPKCPGRLIVENVINGRLKRMCGTCGHGWEVTT